MKYMARFVPLFMPEANVFHSPRKNHHKQGGKVMRGKVLVLGFIVAAIVLSFGAVYGAADNPGQDAGWCCPWRGQGRGMHCGPRGACPMAAQRGVIKQNQDQPVTHEDARQLVEKQLRFWSNPNLKLGDLNEVDGFYEATIVTKDNSLVQKIQVDKNTGWFRNVY
jgi:hypothetical protein